jgi:mRNA interferase MazF
MADETTPPRVKPRIKSAPKTGQVYWCDFPTDAQLPEFWKQRPVVVLSPKAHLYGVVLVVPLSTKAQPDNPLAHAFPGVLSDEGTSWAVCSHPTTVAVSRLSIHRGRIVKVPDDALQAILRIVRDAIPTPRD